MCGITGFLTSAKKNGLEVTVRRMADTIIHRGPDDEGAWVDSEIGVALGFRRLAILDLSPAGHQPMLSACGRYVMVFNGEVYNFLELRRELDPKGHCFRGRSDTEVMLAAICERGLRETVQRFLGMFALAVLDPRDPALPTVRGRFSIKAPY